jgi:uncharacterized membrane protein
LHAIITEIFPDGLGEEHPIAELTMAEREVLAEFERDTRPVCASNNGYVQSIEQDTLMHLAQENDLVLRIEHPPGYFVVKEQPLVQVWPAARLNDDVANAIANAFNLGERQTPTQDIEAAVSQLVEVALRALSPSINDPFTAIGCADQLGAALCHLAKRKIPSPYRRDSKGTLRVVAYPFTFAEVAAAALGPLRQYSRSSPTVLTHLLEMIAVVLSQAQRPEDREALLRQAELIRHCGDSWAEAADRETLEDRFRKVLHAYSKRSANGAMAHADGSAGELTAAQAP